MFETTPILHHSVVDQLSMVNVGMLAEFCLLYCAHFLVLVKNGLLKIFFCIYQLLYMPDGCL